MAAEHETVDRAFGHVAQRYDEARRRLVPCFDGLYGNALDVIADWWPAGRPRVLDLGAGTGLFAAMVADRFPEASVHLVDLSEGMLDQARKRFADLGRHDVTAARVDLAHGELGGPWNLAISALALHHLEDEAKRSLFARIHAALVPGGLFVNAEQVLGPTPAAEARYHRIWEAEGRALGASDDEIAGAVDRMRHDRSATVEDQMGWLREAGFAEVDCTFKSWRFAVITARKA